MPVLKIHPNTLKTLSKYQTEQNIAQAKLQEVNQKIDESFKLIFDNSEYAGKDLAITSVDDKGIHFDLIEPAKGGDLSGGPALVKEEISPKKE